MKEFPEAAQYIMDCNHWFDPKNPKALELKKKVEAKGEFYTYEVYMNYTSVLLLARTMQQQRIRPKGIYSVLGGAASSYKFVKEFPEVAQYIMDCNHWFDPKNPKALALKKKIEDKGEFYTYEVYMNYSCILLLADALERAASADRAKIISAMESSTFTGHVMPYGPTKFVNGQNQGAAPVNTQVIDKDIQVIFPAAFASAKAVFPMPPA